MNQSQNSQVALLIGEFVYNPILLVHISICGKLSLSKAISCPLFVGFTAEVCVESRWQQNWQRSQGWSSHCGYLSRFRLEANRYRVAWRSEGQWVNDAQNTDGKSGLEKLRTFLRCVMCGGPISQSPTQAFFNILQEGWWEPQIHPEWWIRIHQRYSILY